MRVVVHEMGRGGVGTGFWRDYPWKMEGDWKNLVLSHFLWTLELSYLAHFHELRQLGIWTQNSTRISGRESQSLAPPISTVKNWWSPPPQTILKRSPEPFYHCPLAYQSQQECGAGQSLNSSPLERGKGCEPLSHPFSSHGQFWYIIFSRVIHLPFQRYCLNYSVLKYNFYSGNFKTVSICSHIELSIFFIPASGAYSWTIQ